MNRTQIYARHSAVAIRRVCPADRAALGGFFAGLSVTSRTLRFFAPVTPSQSMLSRLAGDATGVEALVATSGGGIVGHAMAADQPGPPGRLLTHVGLVVADAWQGQGVGAALMRALTDGARDRGVTSLVMDVLPENRRVVAMIAGHWGTASTARCADCITIRVPLPPPQHQRPAAWPRLSSPAPQQEGFSVTTADVAKPKTRPTPAMHPA